jgi:hypothetical protein
MHGVLKIDLSERRTTPDLSKRATSATVRGSSEGARSWSRLAGEAVGRKSLVP